MSLSDKIRDPFNIMNPRTRVIWDHDVKNAMRLLKVTVKSITCLKNKLVPCNHCENCNLIEIEFLTRLGERLI